MVEDFPPSTKAALPIVGREILSLLASGLLYPFGLRAARTRTARRRDQRTVVLVHGWLGNRSAFLPMRAWLRTHGIKQVLAYDYASGRGIEQAAIGLRDFLREHVRGGRIDLVCHSLGGLVARVYLQELGGARRVDRCITLGTPHRGTYNAYWVASRIGDELRPGSPLLQRLSASLPAASRVRFTSIAAGSDNIILPRVFAGPDEDSLRIDDTGHVGLLFSKRVFAAVAQRLSAPRIEGTAAA